MKVLKIERKVGKNKVTGVFKKGNAINGNQIHWDTGGKKKAKKKHTHLTQASNPWWCPIKGPKAHGTILENSSTNSNLKLRHLSGNLKGS